MTLIRKVIIVLVGISLALLVTVLFFSPSSIDSLALSLLFTSLLIRIPVAILIDALILAVIVVLVRNERPTQSAQGGLMVKAQGAIADVSVESARDRILRAVRAVPDVVSAEAQVKAIRGRADVDLDVVVLHESNNLPDKQKELDRALRQVINKQLGLQMAGKPRLHIRMEDEKLLVETPAVAPVMVTPEASTPDAVLITEVKADEPLKVETVSVPDAMSLRDLETKSDSADLPGSAAKL